MPFQDSIICKIRNVLFRSSHIFVFWFLVFGRSKFSHQVCLLFFQLLKTSFNWENFCRLTNKKFIFSAKSKHKKNWQLLLWSFGRYVKTKRRNMRWTGHMKCKFISDNLCFVYPIFSSFDFWYFGHFSHVIFFLVFFRLAHLALQNVNKDYGIFSYFRNFVGKSDQKPKTKNGMNKTFMSA